MRCVAAKAAYRHCFLRFYTLHYINTWLHIKSQKDKTPLFIFSSMISEMYVENQRVDISADISSLLTFALDDIKDFSSRQTTFSKTIVLPGTANNNKLFGHIYQAGSNNLYDGGLPNSGYNFNAAKSAACIIFQDNIQTFQGSMRMLQVTVDRGRVEYEVAVFGNLSLLNVALSPNSTAGTGLLENLDFSSYDVAYTHTGITNSWDFVAGDGICFPLIDYGNYSAAKHDWKFGTFRPAIFVKDYIDKMFSVAGFTYDCPLFNSTRFKKLIIPHNQKNLIKYVSNFISASRSTTLTVVSAAGGTTTNSLAWETISEEGFTDSLGKVFTYTGLTTAIMKISFTISGYRKNTSPNGFSLRVKVNGTAIGTQQKDITGTVPIAVPYIWQDDGNFTLTMNTGDTIEWNFDTTSSGTDTTYSIDVRTASLSITSLSGATVAVPVAYGDTISVNDTIPRNIKQIDFLVSIVKLFNLYVYEDQFNPTLLHIKPFNGDGINTGFFSADSMNAVDWTYKLNRTKPIILKPMSELTSRVYNYNYAKDGDFYNDQYNKKWNQTYGSRKFDSEFEFTTDESKLELIFAGTPLVGYDLEEKVYSTIFKRTGNTSPYTEENIDSIIRILQTKHVSGLSDAWDILDGAGSPLTSGLNDYLYAGHYDDPDAPANDIGFGVPGELYFTLSTGDTTKTQFNVYWSGYLADITDKDSKLITAYFYLKPSDIFNLDFSKYVQVDGVLYRLNKITDYNASMPGDCQVELLRVLNTTYSF